MLEQCICSNVSLLFRWQDRICPKLSGEHCSVHLDGFIEVDNDLCGVASEEHDHDGGEEGGHGSVAPVRQQDGVVDEDCVCVVACGPTR